MYVRAVIALKRRGISVSLEQTKDSISLLKGFAAGVVGGLAGTAAKSFAEKMYPPRVEGEPAPPQVMAEKIAGHQLDDNTKKSTAEVIHWVFGAATGGFYGVLAELYPKVTAKNGATFGLTLMSFTHEGALPALGLDQKPEDQSFREHTSEATTHVVYGVVTEKVRSLVRGLLH